jgi:hypothetical protein
VIVTNPAYPNQVPGTSEISKFFCSLSSCCELTQK